MTEQEWLTSTDPGSMLRWLTAQFQPDPKLGLYGGTPIATDRRLRLFAAACCRLVWDGTPCPSCQLPGKVIFFAGCQGCHGSGRVGGMTDPRSRNAVEVAERYADGLAMFSELYRAEQQAMNAWNGINNPPGMARYCCIKNIQHGTEQMTRYGLEVIDPTVQAVLLRDIFGNPFHKWLSCIKCGPVTADKTYEGESGGLGHTGCWKRVERKPIIPDYWKPHAVLAVARSIYDERRWGDMGVLHDALSEAGCDNAGILNHCRQDGPHVRGCVILDLILGKE